MSDPIDDLQRRFREREKEAEQEARVKKEQKNIQSQLSTNLEELADVQSFETLVQKIEPLMNQIQHGYHMYLLGIEKTPPVERRHLLAKWMKVVQKMEKNTARMKFQWIALQSRYITHEERWDKMTKSLEKK